MPRDHAGDCSFGYREPVESHKCLLIETAVLMSYFIGLHKHLFKLKVGEEFYRTRKQQIEDTGLSERRLEKAEREAIAMGLIKKERKGLHTINHYTVNFDAIYALQEEPLTGVKKPKKVSYTEDKMSQVLRTNSKKITIFYK